MVPVIVLFSNMLYLTVLNRERERAEAIAENVLVAEALRTE